MYEGERSRHKTLLRVTFISNVVLHFCEISLRDALLCIKTVTQYCFHDCALSQRSRPVNVLKLAVHPQLSS